MKLIFLFVFVALLSCRTVKSNNTESNEKSIRDATNTYTIGAIANNKNLYTVISCLDGSSFDQIRKLTATLSSTDSVTLLTKNSSVCRPLFATSTSITFFDAGKVDSLKRTCLQRCEYESLTNSNLRQTLCTGYIDAIFSNLDSKVTRQIFFSEGGSDKIIEALQGVMMNCYAAFMK